MMSTSERASDFFVAGGTLRPDSPSYVKRPADDELLHLALAGKFCYVLTARQLGKSSLMIRTGRRLQEHGVSTAIIDLTKIGTEVSVEQWYLGLLKHLKSQLKLSVDSEAWWAERASLSAVQRFTDFLHDVVLAEIEGPVVIFVDEIDTTLSLDFSDDFFAAIRFTYNARATDPAYNRLTFVLLGVATPADLIKDRSRTPFNIGQGIDLREFSREDAQVLQQGLKAAYPEQGDTIFDRIFYWTNGHPYLTQKLCLTVAEMGDGHWTNERVDGLVERLFLSEEARKETNLQFVQDRISASPQRRRLLTLYRKVYEGKAIPEDERSLDQNRLKLFGLVRAERSLLEVRNEIYRRAFDLAWIKANTPVDWTRRMAVISTLLVFLLAGVIGISLYQQRRQTVEARAQAFVDSFQSTTSAEVRITSLAGLFDLPGYEDQARRLFYEELEPAAQLALFDLDNPKTVTAQLITVVKELYTDLKNNEQDNALLNTMAQPLHELDDPMATNLATEIEKWSQGRDYHAQGEYKQAVRAYDVAISLNDHNPGTYFDRGLTYAALGKLSQTLADFQTVLRLDKDWQEHVRQAMMSDAQLYATLWSERDTHPALVALVPTPTSTPTPTATSAPIPSITMPTSTPTWTPTNTPVPPTPTVTPTPMPTPTITLVLPTTTPTGGRIGFVSWRNSTWGIYVMNADDSEQTLIYATFIFTSSLGPMEPSWSPDGQRIAFALGTSDNIESRGEAEIYVINADGSGLKRLTNQQGDDWRPSWSPDGHYIAFESWRDVNNGEIYIMGADGSDQRNLTNNLGHDRGPVWSPDGRRIVFWSDRDGNKEIYVMNANGTEQKRLTDDLAEDRSPSWSPDGELIAFESNRDGKPEIYVMNADGTEQGRLTHNSALDRDPSWSPDGKYIVFESDRDGNYEIYMMNTDGGVQISLTNNPAADRWPFWSPK